MPQPYRYDTMATADALFDEAMKWEYKAYIALLKGGDSDKYWYLTYKGIANIYLNHAAQNELRALKNELPHPPPNRKVIERHSKPYKYGDAHAAT